MDLVYYVSELTVSSFRSLQSLSIDLRIKSKFLNFLQGFAYSYSFHIVSSLWFPGLFLAIPFLGLYAPAILIIFFFPGGGDHKTTILSFCSMLFNMLFPISRALFSSSPLHVIFSYFSGFCSNKVSTNHQLALNM